MKVLVFIEQRDRKIKSSALEALAMGAKLAGSAKDCAALVVGHQLDEGVLGKLKGYGSDITYVADLPELKLYHPLNYAAAIEQAVNTFGADVVVSLASPMGRDLLPRLAARFNGGIVSDITALEGIGGKVQAIKPMYAGKTLAKVTLNENSKKFISIRPNVFKAESTGVGASTVSKLNVTLPTTSLKIVEIRKGASEKVDLTEASVIVSGGRSLGSLENFKIIHELGEVLGATVGASRAAVDSGYAPHDMQVGQTGKTVNPNLYIACGISGSIQHMAGMRTSKVIVAINTDPEAPIFKIATYGIVADLFKAVPIMSTKLKKLLEK
jgi:electron transfer flavoprotein alpha subunit